MSIENTQSHDPKQEGDGSASGLTGSEASPRPWRALQANESVWCIADADNNTVQHIADHHEGADTTLIVQAVNAYDSLVGALEAAEEVLLEALQDAVEWGRGAHLLSPDILSKDEVWRRYDGVEHWTNKLAAALSQVPDSRGGK